MNKDVPNNGNNSFEVQKHHIGEEVSFTWDEDDD